MAVPLLMSVWVEAARPRTLPAAVVPVAAGTAAAVAVGASPAWGRAALALLVALALQVAVNLANDLYDGLAGIDAPDRLGPRRVVAAGLLEPSAVRRGIAVSLVVAAAAGGSLAFIVDVRLLGVGAIAVLAALGYSGGPHPYASRGLGEVFVMVFFGFVATMGSTYVQTGTMEPLAASASITVGLLAVGLMMVNNLRDIPTDAAAGKRTLAVKLGVGRYARTYGAVLLLAFAAVIPAAMLAGSPFPLVVLCLLPLRRTVLRSVRGAVEAEEPQDVGRAWADALGATVRLQLGAGLLLAAGLTASAW